MNPGADSHEFSGIVDFSGLLATDAWGNFVCSAGDGKCKRAAEATVPINGLQAGAALMSGASFVELAPRELRLACLCT